MAAAVPPTTAARPGRTYNFADTSEEKLRSVEERLRETVARDIHRLLITRTALDLPDNTMSRVIAMEVLEHIPNPAEILAELVRVAKPGALFLINVPDARGGELQRHVAPASYFAEPNHIQVLTREAFTELVGGAGLTIEKYFTQRFLLAYLATFQLGLPPERGPRTEHNRPGHYRPTLQRT